MLNPCPIKGFARRAISQMLVISICLLTPSGLLSTVQVSAQTKTTGGSQTDNALAIPVIAPGSAYRQTNLVSDLPGVAFIQDPLLVNPWGISMTASGPFWVANAGSSTSTIYRGDVGGSPLVKDPTQPHITIPGNLPTGTVANPSTTDFVLPGPCSSPPCAADFIFASITGNILGWDPNAPAAGSTTAVIAAHPPNAPPAHPPVAPAVPNVYTGLAVANNGSGNFLYAANFSVGRIDVFNSSYALQPTANFPFADPTIPTTPGNDYHPFNIQAIGNALYVTYAKVGTGTLPEAGVGNGFVRRFNLNGVRDLTFGINNGPLNAPWGLTLAPPSFGIFGGALLVGNFGAGNPSIHAFNPTTGAFLGTLQDESGNGIVIEELWGLIFGNGDNIGDTGGDPGTLYFTAGIVDEEHGLFGSLKPTTATATNLIQFADNDVIIGEGSDHIDITVTRNGDVSSESSVNYATFDRSQPGHASQKSDYEIAVGTLKFEPGATSKSFRILLVDDLFAEGTNGETIDLMLSNPTGAGTGLGSPNVATLTINDNDPSNSTTNPIDDASFFVRQHYRDFLNREPDAAELAFWTDQITSCGGNQACINQRRIGVSAALFHSTEFRDTGFIDILTHRAAYGRNPLYGEFQLGTQALKRNLFIGQPGAPAQFEANKQAYFNEFVTRPEFVDRYPANLTNTEYVNNLLATAGLSPSQVRFFVVNLTNAQENPPANPTSSAGGPRPASFGTARLQFNAAQTAMTFTSTVNNIDFTGSQTSGEANDNLTVAHIHAGAAVTPATNGPVVWGFFGTPFNDNNPNDQQVIPFTSGVGGQINGKWDAPEGNATTLAAQLSNLREGRAYVNFHTTQFPGGEIRGNIPAATSLRDSLIAGLNGSTETRATVLRKIAEQEELRLREQNSASVLMGFFGYLRRDPDPPTFDLLLNRLNSFNGDLAKAGLVRIFLTSREYRSRFGPFVALANTAPDAVDDAATTNVNTPVIINVVANDTDLENQSILTVTSVTPGTGGTPTINANNTVTFTPAANFTGTATFQYTITDYGTGDISGVFDDPKTDTATVTVTVNPVGTIQFNSATYTVNENAGSATITITRTGASTGAATVQFSTSNGTAGSADYTTTNTTVNFANGQTSQTVNIPINNDALDEPNETVNLTISNVTGSGLLGAQATAVLTIVDDDLPIIEFSLAAYTVNENAGNAVITVNRVGDNLPPAEVDFASSDTFGMSPCTLLLTGKASERCDYLTVVGRLKFAAGEASKSFPVFLIDDVHVEGNEVLNLTLSNPSAGSSLGAQSTATLTITDNDTSVSNQNPIDGYQFFVRQQYLDFLYREPDRQGFNNWVALLVNCPGGGFGLNNPHCDRVHIAKSFFGSPEFGDTGYFIYRFYDATLGRRPTFAEFMRDLQKIGGQQTPAERETAKVQFVTEFISRQEFITRYGASIPSSQAAQFVSALEQFSAVVIPEPARSELISQMQSGQKTAGETLRAFIERQEVYDKFFNRGFASMLYFAHLRRDPDAAGFTNYVQLLNTTGNYRQATFDFIFSPEYRSRFGQP
jgi:uncharacterized protein (TIGR03118 family)